MTTKETEAFIKATREAYKPKQKRMKIKTQCSCEVDTPRAARLRKLRQMEKKAAEDIKLATATNNEDWKQKRTVALYAIREEIHEIKGR